MTRCERCITNIILLNAKMACLMRLMFDAQQDPVRPHADPPSHIQQLRPVASRWRTPARRCGSVCFCLSGYWHFYRFIFLSTVRNLLWLHFLQRAFTVSPRRFTITGRCFGFYLSAVLSSHPLCNYLAASNYFTESP